MTLPVGWGQKESHTHFLLGPAAPPVVERAATVKVCRAQASDFISQHGSCDCHVIIMGMRLGAANDIFWCLISSEQQDEKEELNHGRTNIVEWRPEPKVKRKSRKNMGNENGTVTRNQIQDDGDGSPNSEPVTVTIDPPEDHVLEFHTQDGESHSQDSNIPSRQSNSSDDDLTADLDGSESESEEEECESATHTCVCLLSRLAYESFDIRFH